MPKAYLPNPNFGQKQAPEPCWQNTFDSQIQYHAHALQHKQQAAHKPGYATGSKDHGKRSHLREMLAALWTGKVNRNGNLKATKIDDVHERRHHIRFWKNRVPQRNVSLVHSSESSSASHFHNVFDVSSHTSSTTPLEVLEQDLESLIDEACTVIYRPSALQDQHFQCSCSAGDHCSFRYSPSPTAPLNIFGAERVDENRDASCTRAAPVSAGAVVVDQSPETNASSGRFSLGNSTDAGLRAGDSITPVDLLSPANQSPATSEFLDDVETVKNTTEEGRWISNGLKQYCSSHFRRRRRTSKGTVPRPEIGPSGSDLQPCSTRSGRHFLRRWHHPMNK